MKRSSPECIDDGSGMVRGPEAAPPRRYAAPVGVAAAKISPRTQQSHTSRGDPAHITQPLGGQGMEQHHQGGEWRRSIAAVVPGQSRPWISLDPRVTSQLEERGCLRPAAAEAAAGRRISHKHETRATVAVLVLRSEAVGSEGRRADPADETRAWRVVQLR